MTRDCCQTPTDCFHSVDCPKTSEDDGMRALHAQIEARGKQSAAHVRAGSASRARGGYVFTPDRFTDLGGIPVLTSPAVPEGQALWSVDPATGAAAVFVGEHDRHAGGVIAAELVACTLGARARPELLVPGFVAPPDRLAVLVDRIRAGVRQAGQSVVDAVTHANKVLNNLQATP